MNSIAVLRPANYRRLMWKNGLGFTDEIAIFPPQASLVKGDFLWRISTAKIEHSSAFSIFPNHDRVLVVLKGGAIQLTHTFDEGETEQVELPVLTAYDFPGDVPSTCNLKQGPVQDLSVFVQKGCAEATVDRIDLQEGATFEAPGWNREGRWNFIFAASGSFQVAEGPAFGAGETLVVPGSAEAFPPEAPGIRCVSAEGVLLRITLHSSI